MASPVAVHPMLRCWSSCRSDGGVSGLFEMMRGDQGEAGELLLPPDITRDAVKPLSGGRTLRLDGETMGTYWSLSAVVDPAIDDGVVRALLLRGFDRIIAQMSQWEPESEISRFNRAPAGTEFPISAEFAYVLDCAVQIAAASGGAFDPTLGEVSEQWGFGAGPAPGWLPTPGKEATRYRWADLQQDETGRHILQPGGLRLDLSGIAKGFAVDYGMRQLEQAGIRHALLEIGGELRGAGVQADGLPWWVDIDIPPDSTAIHARVALTGWSIATSGNYRRRRSAEGRSWSHSLDPVGAAPLSDHMLSATVLHQGCMQADALATVIMVLGPDHGLAFADAHGIPARMVSADGTVCSAAWRHWADDSIS